MPNDNWKTLRVPPDAYAAAKEQKEAADRTWGEQIVRPEGGVGDLEPFGGEVPDLGDLTGATAADIDQLRELVEQVPERTADELEGRFR